MVVMVVTTTVVAVVDMSLIRANHATCARAARVTVAIIVGTPIQPAVTVVTVAELVRARSQSSRT